MLARGPRLTEPQTDTDLLDLLRLTMVPGVGPQTVRALLKRFGSPGRVLSASISELRTVQNVGPKLAEKISRAAQDCDAESELALCQRSNVRLLPRDRPGYPPALENIPDPPGLLYCQGQLEPRDQLAIAMVGSRHCTPYGLRVAERLAAGLARVGITVVSGLARGIDAAAHRGALKAGGRSIAVLANGLASVYPPEHVDLARALGRGRRPPQRDADAAGPARRALHPEKPPDFGALPRGRCGGSHTAERVAVDGQSRDGAEPRGVRRAGAR